MTEQHIELHLDVREGQGATVRLELHRQAIYYKGGDQTARIDPAYVEMTVSEKPSNMPLQLTAASAGELGRALAHLAEEARK